MPFVVITTISGLIGMMVLGQEDSPLLFIVSGLIGWVLAYVYGFVGHLYHSFNWGALSVLFNTMLTWIVTIAVSVALSLILSWIFFKIINFIRRRRRYRRHCFPRIRIIPRIVVFDARQPPLDENLFNQGVDDGVPPNPNQNN